MKIRGIRNYQLYYKRRSYPEEVKILAYKFPKKKKEVARVLKAVVVNLMQ